MTKDEELDLLRRREAALLEVSRQVVRWIKYQAGWEGFWEDMNWQSKAATDRNIRELKSFLARYLELLPELKE